MMLIDITVKDAEAAAAGDMIGVYTLAVGTGEFENNRSSYGMVYSKGVKDEEDPNLFHVSTRVPPKWVTNGEEVTFDIVSIHMRGDNETPWEIGDNELSGLVSDGQNIAGTDFYQQETDDFGISLSELRSRIKVYNVDMQFRFTIPQNVLKETVEKNYDELAFEVNGRTYRLHYAEFGAHRTIIRFDYDNAGYDYHVDPETDKKAAEQFTLTVDGAVYKPDIDNTGSFTDDQGNCNLGIKDMCYMSLYFPAFSFENAQRVTLSANGVSCELK